MATGNPSSTLTAVMTDQIDVGWASPPFGFKEMEEGQIRIVAPDVGGGFGYKDILLPEEVALAWGTRRLGVPLRWLEDGR